MRFSAAVYLAIALCGATNSVQADTIVYDTLTGTTLATGCPLSNPTACGTTLGYVPSSNQSTIIGVQFDPTVTGYIKNLETSISTASNASATYALGVYSDNSGSVGALLETLTITANGGSVTNNSYGSGTILNAGTPYWIVAGVGTSVTQGTWWFENATSNKPEVDCNRAASGNVGALPCGNYFTGATNPLIGLQISMPSAVPLPAAAWLLLSGLGGLGFLRRKRHSG